VNVIVAAACSYSRTAPLVRGYRIAGLASEALLGGQRNQSHCHVWQVCVWELGGQLLG
jgi:hypothetical protein